MGSSGNAIISNNVILNAAMTDNTLGNRTEFAGQISGTADLSVNGLANGNIILSGSNTGWSGNLTFVGQPKVSLNNIHALGTGTAITFNTPGTAGNLRGQLESTVALTGANALTQTVNLGAASGLAGNDAVIITTADMELKGVVSGAVDAKLVKQGAGQLILSGNNDYLGDTEVTAGELLVNGDQSAATGTITVSLDAVLGGDGTVGGNIVFADGAKFLFDAAATLTANGTLVDLGNLSVANLIGLDGTVAEGIYTLIDGTATFDFTGVQNLGLANAYDLGGGKSAYFQEGSLDLVVIPEPATVGMLGLGALMTLMIRRMRIR
jgi:fibronectin-binding autotransporter adhesin